MAGQIIIGEPVVEKIEVENIVDTELITQTSLKRYYNGSFHKLYERATCHYRHGQRPT